MKSLALISSMVVGAFSSGLEEQIMKDLFLQWKQTHNKVYNGLEEEYRFNTFTQNYLDILEFNSKQDDVTLGLNQFGDLTSEEFGALYTGFMGSSDPVEEYHVIDSQDPPASVDWRTKGAVTPVKNQGSCGSCWTFSATGALEGLYFIDGNTLTSFSEQNLVDCVTADQGCNGGLMTDAFDYTAQSKGIETEADYPYKGVDGTCAFQQSKAILVNSGYYNVTPQNVTQLKLAIAQQPVSVAIQANQLVFQFYAGGVIKRFCGDSLDHGVLAVGYGLIKGYDAFIVKNSWGGSWGADGYVYISTDADANKGNGVCGILSVPAYPIKQ